MKRDLISRTFRKYFLSQIYHLHASMTAGECSVLVPKSELPINHHSFECATHLGYFRPVAYS